MVTNGISRQCSYSVIELDQSDSFNLEMATPYGGLGLDGIKKFDDLSKEIEKKFNDLHSLLETKKIQLLARVREMKELYQKHRDIDKSIEQLEGIIKATKDALTENLLAGSKEMGVSLWEDKVKDLRREKDKLDSVCELKFLPNMDEMPASINRIHLRDCGVVEFKRRREPLVMTGKRGGNAGEMYEPKGVAVDRETDLVFVADFCKELISVYSLEGEFIKSFGDGKLRGPYGICISEEFVFVTDMIYDSVVKFLTSGEYVCDSKSQSTDIQWYTPNLCIHNQSVYVCDSIKNKIDIFTFDLQFMKSFGESKLGYPRDIKTHRDTIFVLTQVDNSIHSFNAQHEFIRSIPLTGHNNANIPQAFFFTIDVDGNFVISNRDNDCLKIFSPTGQYTDSLGNGYLAAPQGIATDRHNRIVSVSESIYCPLQIY